MNINLFDPIEAWNNLLPLTFTKPIAALRVGHFTIAEKWENIYNCNVGYKTQNYLQEKYASNKSLICVNGQIIPTKLFYDKVVELKENQALYSKNKILIAYNGIEFNEKFECLTFEEDLDLIHYPQDIFLLNEKCIEQDFLYFLKNKKRAELYSCNDCTEPENVFVEEGATVLLSSLNPQNKKIIIAKDAELMEGTRIRGAFSIGPHSQTKMDTKIYGATTIGEHSKVGGELNNVVIQGYSNKAHDGFLGNAVIGEWCNIGADTNNSNLKNNYTEVKLWNYPSSKFINTNLQFCGLIMADHAKCGINTMFNTGTVVGVASNIFGAGFPRQFIPDFSWGGAAGFSTYRIEDALQTANLVMQRRNLSLSAIDKEILTHIFNNTEHLRKQ